MSQLIQFLLCFALGLALRLIYKAVTFLEKKTALVPVTIILDAALACVAVLAFGLISFFFCEGQIFSYLVAGVIVGFGLTALLI